jgi:hypothetical protein
MKQKVSKLQAAQRQLGEAIVLYFERRDAIAVHTLAAAAHQVFFDLCVKKGSAVSLLKDCRYIRPDKHAVWLRKVAEAGNFFKHADRDPEASFEFNPAVTIYFLVDAIQLHIQLTGDYPLEGRIFMSHFVRLNPDILEPRVAATLLPALAQTGIDPNDYKQHLETIQLIREHGSTEAALEYLKNGGDVPKAGG